MFRRFFNGLAASLFCFLLPCFALSSEDEVLLRESMTPFMEHMQDESVPLSFTELSTALQLLKKAPSSSCVESYALKNSTRFITSFNSDGNPCRVLDLEYPGFFRKKGGIPLVDLSTPLVSTKTFLQFVQGKEQEAFNSYSSQKIEYSRQVSSQLLDALQIDAKTAFRLTQKGPISIRSLLKKDFQLSEDLKKTLKELPNFQPLNMQFPLTHLSTPEKALEQIQLSWVSQSQTFALNIHHLEETLRPQVALLDFSRPQDLLWKKVYMQVARSILSASLAVIPDPVIARIVGIGINDLLDLYNFHLKAQYHKLEATLRMNLSQQAPTAIGRGVLDRSLDMLTIDQGSTIWNYVKHVVAQKRLDLRELALFANETRQANDLGRDQMRLNGLNALRGKGCEVEAGFEYFAVCKKAGQPQSIHSLIATGGFWFLNFGPQTIYHFKNSYQILLKRTLAWGLSVAARISTLNSWLTRGLSWILKSYASKGLYDEAFFSESLRLHRDLHPAGLQFKEVNDNWLKWQSLDPTAFIDWRYKGETAAKSPLVDSSL